MGYALTTMLTLAGLIILGIFGWVMNAYKLIAVDIDIENNKPLIARSVGIVIPVVGAVEGWMTFDAEKTKAAK